MISIIYSEIILISEKIDKYLSTVGSNSSRSGQCPEHASQLQSNQYCTLNFLFRSLSGIVVKIGP